MSLEKLARSVKRCDGKNDAGAYFDFLSEKDCCLWGEIEDRLRLNNISFEIRELCVWNMFATVIYAGDSILFLSQDNGLALFFWCNRAKIKQTEYADYICRIAPEHVFAGWKSCRSTPSITERQVCARLLPVSTHSANGRFGRTAEIF